MIAIRTVLLILLILWIASLFIAPLSLPPGTVLLGESGKANLIDFTDVWIKLPPCQRIVYVIGDAICHQKTSRSLIVNGNQMPVCARDTGLYLGIAFSLMPLYFLELFRPEKYSLLIKKIFRPWWKFLLIYIPLVLPLIIDFSTQLLGLRTSNNALRLVTGIPFGLGNGILFYHLLLEDPGRT